MCRKEILAIVIKNYAKAGIKSKYQLFYHFSLTTYLITKLTRYINQRSSVPHVN